MPYAVVTGASQGIGKAITEKLLSQGFSVAICARSQENLDEAAAGWAVTFPGSEVLALAADLGKKEDVQRFAARVCAAFPQIDILVNNAGLFFPGRLMDEPEGHMETLMEVNFYSAYHLTRKLVPGMQARKSGHIFNISSIAALRAYENGGAYSITKHALLGFSENLRQELMADQIRVTTMVPGATWSRTWEQSSLPEHRFMKAEDIANMVWAAYSLSSQADVETIIMRPMQGDI